MVPEVHGRKTVQRNFQEASIERQRMCSFHLHSWHNQYQALLLTTTQPRFMVIVVMVVLYRDSI